MKKFLIELKKICLSIVCCFALTQVALASDLELSAIEISNENDGYDIILKTDKKGSYKKIVNSENQVSIELKNATTSSDFATIYKNVSSIDNVAVLPIGNGDLKIEIQGANIEKSNVTMSYVDAPVSVAAQNFNPNEVNLNLPVDSYRPVYNQKLEDNESFDELSEESNVGILAKVKEVLNVGQSESLNQETSSNGNYDWMTYLGLFIIIAVAGMNLFKSSDDKAIGLAQSLKDKDMTLAKKLNLDLKNALSLQSKNDISQDLPSINYGLKAYQNSQKNPYDLEKKYQDMEKENSLLKNAKKKEFGGGYNAIRKQPSVSNPVAQIREKMANNEDRAVNIDSAKFLNSMSKIYERSGRIDLAQGLKENLKKVKV